MTSGFASRQIAEFIKFSFLSDDWVLGETKIRSTISDGSANFDQICVTWTKHLWGKVRDVSAATVALPNCFYSTSERGLTRLANQPLQLST